MKRLLRLIAAVTFAAAFTISASAPAGASPADPTTLDELRLSPGYRSNHADVLRLYRAFFNREPDIEGTLYWMGIYDEGATLDDLAWAFANSTEFISAFGGALSDSEFLDIVYGNVLGRTPDSEGKAYWLEQMAGGLSQSGVVRWVVANPEFITSYPYPDTGGDLSGSLLALTDMPAGWIQHTTGDRTADTGDCESLFRYPTRATLFAVFEGPGNGAPIVSNAVHAYPSSDGAAAYLAQVRVGLDTCARVVYSDGSTATLSTLPFPEMGDEIVATQRSYTDASGQYAGYSQEVSVRYGSVVASVSHGGLGPIDEAFTVDLVGLALLRVEETVGP